MLCTSQLTLGSTSIFFGFFVHKWSTLQDRYLRSRGLPHERNQAHSAMRSVTAALLLQVHNIWLIRNAHLHQTDPMQQHSYTHIYLLSFMTVSCLCWQPIATSCQFHTPHVLNSQLLPSKPFTNGQNPWLTKACRTPMNLAGHSNGLTIISAPESPRNYVT